MTSSGAISVITHHVDEQHPLIPDPRHDRDRRASNAPARLPTAPGQPCIRQDRHVQVGRVGLSVGPAGSCAPATPPCPRPGTGTGSSSAPSSATSSSAAPPSSCPRSGAGAPGPTPHGPCPARTSSGSSRRRRRRRCASARCGGCLRGHRSPATMVEPGKVAQLRAADRQSRNHLINGGTLAETLAEQSELSRILHRFRLSDPMTGRLLEAQRRLVHCSSEDFGSRVERDSYDHPLWRACTSRTPADVCQYVAVGGRSMATTALQASRRSPARVSGR